MQNYAQYKSGIHTASQATDKLVSCCDDFSYRFGLRVLLTFQGALLFILALQTSTLISVAIDDPIEGQSKEFNLTRFGIIMIILLVVIILSYVKEYYVQKHDSYGKVDYDLENAKTGVHWAHGHYQH